MQLGAFSELLQAFYLPDYRRPADVFHIHPELSGFARSGNLAR
jgi:hypothetical protein